MTTEALAIIVLIGGFFVLLMIRVPISFAMLLSTLGCALITGTNLTVIVQQMISGVNSFTLLAIPFFILMGEFMSEGGISEKIVDFATLCVGRFRGGLAYVNCLDSMFFGGISGSAVADVSSLGSVVVPMMVKQGYSPEFSVGLTVTTACQGLLIPPSHNMVIYALAAGGGVTIGSLFMAGAVPGVFLGLCMLVFCFLTRKHYNFPEGVRTPREKWGKIIINAVLPMFTIVIIMVGVAAGVFTATESAAIACVYTFLLTYVVFRTGKLRNIGHVFKRTLKTLAIVLTLIAIAKAFAYMMVELRVPDMLTNFLVGLTSNRIVLLMIINLLLLLMGCFMDMAPLIMIMTPILLPVVTSPAIGMSPVHFGIVMIFNLAIGLCTPPVGSALYVGCAVGKTSIERTSVQMLPMYGVMIVALLIVTYLPFFSMWLPTTLGMV
ncbi:MAG: TRAP transporter large permease [Eubacteriales bacterium]|nr:TRAP transporter large permease [Eubacteriales bacterium]